MSGAALEQLPVFNDFVLKDFEWPGKRPVDP
jgi:hypothetical protein